MSPRPYDLGRRQAQVDANRRRVLDAARELLGDATAYTGFTVDAVARRADVARATVYYQFGSKTGLLEALCDDLAERGGMERLADADAFAEADAARALDRFIAAFGRFWSADREVTRRLRALARLDPEVAGVIEARDERKRAGLRVLAGEKSDESVRVLDALTSFETFDALAGDDRQPADVVPIVTRLVRAAQF
jgi:AcrR family transcriptional regulator